ncbi:MAG TPA: DNA polymerase IV [Eubacteriaceae bacterium]|nr:DNA polymerase IV [Eubacteriaceae bacterium]
MDRVVFLVDMNAFFISCEATRNPELQNKPAAVAGSPEKRTGIILASNYIARKYGVRTAMTVHQGLKLCPEMLLVPPDHIFYEYKSSELIKTLYNYTPIIQKNSIDEAWLDMTGTEKLFGTPVEAAKKIMEEIKEKLGLWCSIGISENKFLSKMAADMKKPLGITELWKKDIEVKLWPLPIGKMYGVGKKTSKKLNTIGITTIGDLARQKRDIVYKTLGNSGIELQQLARGIDPSPVEISSPDDMKSIGRSTTLPEDIRDLEKLKLILMDLSEDVARRARRHNKKGCCVQITLKYSDFKVITRQTTLAPTYFTKDIYEAGKELLEKNFTSNKAVRLIGITLKGFDDNCDSQQISLFSTELDGNKRYQSIDRVMDNIRNKYGKEKIGRASLLTYKDDKNQ